MSAPKYEFDMAMTCGGCAGAAKRVLEKLGVGNSDIDTDVDNKKVFVTTNEFSSDQLLEALKKTGKEVAYVGIKN